MNNQKLLIKLKPEEVAGCRGNAWMSISKCSELLNIKPQSIREAIKERDGKYKSGCYIFRTTVGKGGKQYEILLASLPEHIQAEYWLKHHKPANSTLPALTPEQENSTFDHEVYEAIADQYSRKSARIKEKAIRRVTILDEYLKLLKGGFKKEKALKIIQSNYAGISKATLWRWFGSVEKHPRQYWEVILAPDFKGRARTEIDPRAWDFFFLEYGQLSEPDATVIYRETVKAAVKNGWGELPSCRTFLRRWETDVPENEKILLRKGRTALKESLPHLKRDYTTLRVHEVWESDGRVADVFCLWPDGTISRPWAVVIRDARTRMPLAIKVYKSTNAELVIDAFRYAVILSGTIPIYFAIDNGPEYSNNPFTGGQKSPFRFTVIEDQPIGVLSRLGVEPLWATPYHGAAKAIESWWNVMANNVDKLCGAAYTGPNPVKRPENCDKKYAIPIEEYTKRLSACVVSWAKGEFGKHRGQGMNGMSPLELYNHLMQDYAKIPASVEHIRSMRPLVFRRVLSKQLVFQMTIPGFGQVEYTPQDNLKVKRGYSYDILPDPSDPKEPALIYDGAVYMGEATYKDHTPFLHETAGGDIWKERSSKAKKARTSINAVKDRVKSAELPLAVTNEGLPDLLQSNLMNVLKLPKAPPPEQENIIQIQYDGSLLNTQTGELIKPVKRSIISGSSNSNEEKEAERKRKEKEDRHFEAWNADASRKNHSGGNLNDSDTTPNGTYKEL